MLEGVELGWETPSSPRRRSPAGPRVGRRRERRGSWNQGGDAAHPRGQSRAQPLSGTAPSPSKPDRKTRWKNPAGSHPILAAATVTPLLFSSSPGWPGGGLPHIPQRPTGKAGESPQGTGAQWGPPSVPKEGGVRRTPTHPAFPPGPAPRRDQGVRGSTQGPAPHVFRLASLLCQMPWVLGCAVVGSVGGSPSRVGRPGWSPLRSRHC